MTPSVPKRMLGWIPPHDRTDDQHEAHHDFLASLPKYALPQANADLPVGGKLLLTDLWKHPGVISQLGLRLDGPHAAWWPAQAFSGIHQLTGSCFPAGTPVRMADGSETAIENIAIGDEVVSHQGRKRKVLDTMQRKFTGDMVTITPVGFVFPLTMTADHQVAVVTINGRSVVRWPSDKLKYSLEWKRAADLTHDDHVLIGWRRDANTTGNSLDIAAILGEKCVRLNELMKDHAHTKGCEPQVVNSNVGSARHFVRKSGMNWRDKVKLYGTRNKSALKAQVPICPSLGRFIGLYLAEGGTHDGVVVFTFHRKETAYAAEVLALAEGLFGAKGFIAKQNGRPNVLKVRFNNKNLAAVLEHLAPGKVWTKRVPAIFFSTDDETKRALIGGWMDGDGHSSYRLTKRGCNELRIQGVTASEGLARDMTVLSLSCGYTVSTSRRKAYKQSKEAMNLYYSGTLATEICSKTSTQTATKVRFLNDKKLTPFGYARKISKIERTPVVDLQVYDFEVEEDHSFLAGDLTVHNCVGCGGGNALFSLIAGDALLRGDAEGIVVPFWPLPYGRSRYYCGDRGQGEGSLGSTFAKAVLQDGVLDANDTSLPQFQVKDGLVWGEKVEYAWSDGAAISADFLTNSRKHLVKSAVPLHTTQDVWNQIANGYPVTRAATCFCDVQQAKVQGSGNDSVLVGNYGGYGGHQMSYQGIYNHPTLGRLFLEVNQWGDVYGQDPAGGPPSSCWQTEANVSKMIRSEGSEVYAFSGFDGFPPRNIMAFMEQMKGAA